MPATERRFSEPLPDQIYLDADVLIGYLVTNEPNHNRSLALINRLVVAPITTAYISTPTWLEYAQVVGRARFREQLSPELQQRYRIRDWHLRSVRTAYYRGLLEGMEDLLARLQWGEVGLTTDVRTLAIDYMARYALGSQDAAHLASATLAGVDNFASFDEAFRRVDGLQLWNDRVYPN